MSLGTEMYRCRGCRIIDPMTYTGPEVQYWTLENGMTWGLVNGQTIPLSSDFVPCDLHRKALIDGTDRSA
jgi:hypothetical protein